MHDARTRLEQAAAATLTEHNIQREHSTEAATVALAWELGGNGADFETVLATLVKHAIEQDRAHRDDLTPEQHDTLQRLRITNWKAAPHTLENNTLTVILIEDDIDVEEIVIEADGNATKSTLDGIGDGWSRYALIKDGSGQHWSSIY